MKKILITGSNGLLGQKLVGLLGAESNQPVIATSFSEDIMRNNTGYLFELMDITNPAEVDYILSKHEPEVIIHTAALTQVAQCEIERENAWKINVEATENLAKEANKYGAQFIYLSSDFIFDGSRGQYREEDPTGPLNYYGQTKLEAERKVIKFARKWAIIRTCLVYGVNFTMSRPNFYLWIKHSLENNERIQINNDQWRTPTLVEDLAKACIDIANQGVEGLYHISGKEYLRILEFAYLIADFFKLDKKQITSVSSLMLDETGRRPLHTGFNIEKAQHDLQYQPHGLTEGIEIVAEQLKSMEAMDD